MSHTRRPALIITDTPRLQHLERMPLEFEVHRVGSSSELMGALDRAGPQCVVLADPYMEAVRSEPSAWVRRAILYRGSIPVVAALHLRECHPDHFRVLLAWQVSAVYDLSLEMSYESISDVVREVRARPLKRQVQPIISNLSERAQLLIRGACEAAMQCGGKRLSLAEILGYAERTVSDWYRKESLPPPRRILAWTRVILATMMLGEHRRTFQSVVDGSGYATSQSLRRTLRELGVGTPPYVKREDLLSRALRAFAADLHSAANERTSNEREPVTFDEKAAGNAR